jgi:hypothetical protein
MNDKKHTSISIDIYSPDGEIISRKGFNINRMENIMIQYISRKGFNINRMENIMIQYISRQGFNINRMENIMIQLYPVRDSISIEWKTS